MSGRDKLYLRHRVEIYDGLIAETFFNQTSYYLLYVDFNNYVVNCNLQMSSSNKLPDHKKYEACTIMQLGSTGRKQQDAYACS